MCCFLTFVNEPDMLSASTLCITGTEVHKGIKPCLKEDGEWECQVRRKSAHIPEIRKWTGERAQIKNASESPGQGLRAAAGPEGTRASSGVGSTVPTYSSPPPAYLPPVPHTHPSKDRQLALPSRRNKLIPDTPLCRHSTIHMGESRVFSRQLDVSQ